MSIPSPEALSSSGLNLYCCPDGQYLVLLICCLDSCAYSLAAVPLGLCVLVSRQRRASLPRSPLTVFVQTPRRARGLCLPLGLPPCVPPGGVGRPLLGLGRRFGTLLAGGGVNLVIDRYITSFQPPRLIRW
jgi:hypothetical protein